MKMKLKNYLFSVMGMNACIFLFLSLLVPNGVTVKLFHLMVCVSIPFLLQTGNIPKIYAPAQAKALIDKKLEEKKYKI